MVRQAATALGATALIVLFFIPSAVIAFGPDWIGPLAGVALLFGIPAWCAVSLSEGFWVKLGAGFLAALTVAGWVWLMLSHR